MTARQLLSILRLCQVLPRKTYRFNLNFEQSLARLRLSTHITVEDVDEAIRLVRLFFHISFL